MLSQYAVQAMWSANVHADAFFAADGAAAASLMPKARTAVIART
jgi:hypothetical protein